MYYKHIHSYLFTLRSMLLTLCYYLHSVEWKWRQSSCSPPRFFKFFFNNFWAISEPLLSCRHYNLSFRRSAEPPELNLCPLMDGDPTSCWWTMGIIREFFFFSFFFASDGFYVDQYWSVARHLCWRLDLVFPWKYCRIIISPLSRSGVGDSLVSGLNKKLEFGCCSFPCNRGY